MRKSLSVSLLLAVFVGCSSKEMCFEANQSKRMSDPDFWMVKSNANEFVLLSANHQNVFGRFKTCEAAFDRIHRAVVYYRNEYEKHDCSQHTKKENFDHWTLIKEQECK